MKPATRRIHRPAKRWESYERLAQCLLNRYASDFGLQHVEKKQYIPGLRSGTRWEIDAKGICQHGRGIVLVEVRRYKTKKLNQEAMGAFAYRIQDTGAVGGIIVTPIGLQSGAKQVAADANVQTVLLIPGEDNHSFLARFLMRVVVGMPTESLQVSVGFVSATLTTVADSK